jgi:hypothetical protein
MTKTIIAILIALILFSCTKGNSQIVSVGAGVHVESGSPAVELQAGAIIAKSFPIVAGFMAVPSAKVTAPSVFNVKFGKLFDLNEQWYIGVYTGYGRVTFSESTKPFNVSKPLFSFEIVKRLNVARGQIYISGTNVGNNNFVTVGLRGFFYGQKGNGCNYNF